MSFRKANFGTLNIQDIVKGVLVAFLTSTLTGIYDTLQSGGQVTQELVLLHVKAGTMAGLAYIIKNVLSNSKGEFLTKEK